MANILPDELIKEILTPALKVPDDLFSNTSTPSPFSTYSRSTSAYLVVAKAWLRVATPLLYHVVILRSKAQAQALEATLHANPQLGKHIKKLRVEGGYGTALYSIIKSAHNLKELFLSLEIWSSDSISGLCRGLPKANPTRVIVHDPGPYRRIRNALIDKLLEVICECIKSWKHLESFDFPYTTSYQCVRAEKIALALKAAPSLKTITLRSQLTTMYLAIMAQNPSLQSIHMLMWRGAVRYPWQSAGAPPAVENAILKDAALRRLVQIEYPDIAPQDAEASEGLPLLPSYNPTFVPLQSAATEVKEAIWGRAIHFAMLQEEEYILDHRYFCESRGVISRRLEITGHHILQVSKMFHKLGIPHVYKCIVVQDDRSLGRLADTLRNNPSLGSHIRSLFTRLFSSSMPSSQLRNVLSYTPHLVCLGSLQSRQFMTPGGEMYSQGPVLNFQGLSVLSKTAGATLIELTGQAIARPNVPQSPSSLYGFRALRVLDWQSPAKLKFSPANVPADALAKLETLTFASVCDSFLCLLGHMKYVLVFYHITRGFSLAKAMAWSLPALRHVSFPNTSKMEGADVFLKKHGAKLVSLETKSTGSLEWCPSLHLLAVSDASGLGCDGAAQHAALCKIIVMNVKHVPDGAVRDTYRYLGDLDLALFPALREIQVSTCKWPTTEHDIKKGCRSNWVKWAEHLQKWDVELTDPAGKKWVSRLKEV